MFWNKRNNELTIDYKTNYGWNEFNRLVIFIYRIIHTNMELEMLQKLFVRLSILTHIKSFEPELNKKFRSKCRRF